MRSVTLGRNEGSYNSLDGVVGTVTRLRAGRGSNPGSGNGFFSSPKRSRRLRDPPSLLFRARHRNFTRVQTRAFSAETEN